MENENLNDSQNNQILKTNFLEKVSGNLMKVGSFMGQQRHFSAIRDAFGAFLPLLIVGAIAVMINSVFIQSGGLLATLFGAEEGNALFESWSKMSAYVSPLFDGINNATMNLFALYIAFLLGFFLMGSYGGNQLMGGLIGLATFMLLDPMLISAGGQANTGYLGAKGIIFAFATGLTAPMLLFKLQNMRSLQINMPEGVPPVVGNSLNSLFPFIITILTFGLFQPIWGGIMMAASVGKESIDGVTGNNLVQINNAIYDVYFITNAFYALIVVPFMNLAQSPFAIFLILFLIGLFWFFGVHGNNVMGPVVNALWTPAIVANVAILNSFGGDIGKAIESGQLFNWTEQTMNSFALFGGASSVLALLIGIQIFSKLPAQRAISSIATPIACFNISEPVMFGLPVVLNPAYFVPFIFTGSIQGLVAFYFTKFGIVNPTVVLVPWTTPLFLSGILSTLDWRSIILTAINLSIAIFLYLPFILFDIKSQTKAQAEAAGMEFEEYKEVSRIQMLEDKIERKVSKPIDKLKYKIDILEADASFVEKKINSIEMKLGMKLASIEQQKGFAEHNAKVYENLKQTEKAIKEKAKLKKVEDKLKTVNEKFNLSKDKQQLKLNNIQKEIEEINMKIEPAKISAEKEIEKLKKEIHSQDKKSIEVKK